MRRFAALLASLVLAGPVAHADHLERHVGPSEPARAFPDGFVAPVDRQAVSTLSEWSDPRVGGWGAGPSDAAVRRPVVFVHGNTEDASFWTAATCCAGLVENVRQRFLDAGYSPHELWAISYTGGRGYFTHNDVNVEETYEFIAEVRRFTGAEQVDVVAHSLGVTVVRKAAFLHRELYDWIGAFVAIAGANQGTTSCRGPRTATGPAGAEHGPMHVSHGCEETEPGSPWLDELNSIGQTPDGPRYLTIRDSVADQFYLGPDAGSPTLDGACNVDLPLRFHLPLARGADALDVYLPFLRDGTDPCA